MRKIFSALVLLTLCGIFNLCSANKYDDDANYYLAKSGFGVNLYIDLRTVRVQLYNPPYYIIQSKIISVKSRPYTEDSYYISKRYDWNKKETFTFGSDGNWQKDEIKGSDLLSKYSRNFCDALFRVAYGIDFYGY